MRALYHTDVIMCQSQRIDEYKKYIMSKDYIYIDYTVMQVKIPNK